MLNDQPNDPHAPNNGLFSHLPKLSPRQRRAVAMSSAAILVVVGLGAFGLAQHAEAEARRGLGTAPALRGRNDRLERHRQDGDVAGSGGRCGLHGGAGEQNGGDNNREGGNRTTDHRNSFAS